MATTEVKEVKNVSITHADPSAIGLFGLAIVTLVASSEKLGMTSGYGMLLPWVIFLGSIAQMIACIVDCKKNNVFGMTAFGAYGLFWLGVAMSWLVKMGALGQVLGDSADPKQMGFAFLGYLIFTLFMTFASLKTNKTLMIIFILIDVLFLGLTLSTFDIAHGFFHTLAAYAELLIALVSFYGCGANVINATYKKVVLPLGKPIR